MRYRKGYLYYQKEIMPSGNLWLQYILNKKIREKENKIFSLIQKIKSNIKHNILDRDMSFIKKIINNIKDNNKKILDKSMYFVALIWPIMTIPQTIAIFKHQDASSMSIATWITYIITSSLWLSYWIIHKEKPIIFSNTMWLVANCSVLFWIIIYR
jgi:uncharacterized protein with PQ loop repeat